MSNLILATDSYKIGGHWNMLPNGVERIYSYFESRDGAEYPATLFFGLQYYLKAYLEGVVITQEDIEEAESVVSFHLGGKQHFNRAGWDYILNAWKGRLPVEIKAVPEGTLVQTGNVLMTVENTDDRVPWLTNYLETLLSKVWATSTVATVSYFVKQHLKKELSETADDLNGLPFMLHDFGYRGVSSEESAGICGAAHLVNFKGTDTIASLLWAEEFYGADLQTLGFSIGATEHSIMTSLGKDGEEEVLRMILDRYPSGLLSVVSDSFDIYNFVSNLVCDKFGQQILAREGTFVIRPDSVTKQHPTPASEVVWILQKIWSRFGGKINSKGYKVLTPKVRVIWGDGLTPIEIQSITKETRAAGFSVENLVFGMGGGLLQRVNRDTLRFAFKCCAQKRDGVWWDVYKDPIDSTKKSKRGRLKLVSEGKRFRTVKLDERPELQNELVTVFKNGEVVCPQTFDAIRNRANQ